MKNLVLAGALVAVLVSPAFAEEPLNPNDPYNTNEEHLSAQSRETERGLNVQTSPQAGTTDWDWGQSTNGMSNRNDRESGKGIRERQDRDGRER
jgi:hypothetical protein